MFGRHFRRLEKIIELLRIDRSLFACSCLVSARRASGIDLKSTDREVRGYVLMNARRQRDKLNFTSSLRVFMLFMNNKLNSGRVQEREDP